MSIHSHENYIKNHSLKMSLIHKRLLGRFHALTGHLLYALIYSNKKDTSDFHDTVSFDPVKMSQQKISQNVYQTSDTQNLVII